MTRNEIIAALKKYFKVSELVCDHTYAKYKEKSWQYLRTEYLHNLLIIRRDILKAGMVCNYSGHYQRGTRCNMCEMVKGKNAIYLSAHTLGAAGDFTVTGMTAEEARKKIKAAASKLPYPLRMEKGVTWLHIDTIPQEGVTEKVYEFTA